ncbi:Uracil phosphoribosyltransferase protein [Lasiodiplodia theobromae]|uniref:Uracil phosphoribosyltransferase protein n=1 Tax=Lasiodiplodia theobromae TaxID=45133 RepID=UPI0015C2F1B7|nr:Uracil phosphoribosyltransferase protein [Lasiodiplodia theobromae]KAF4534686.1 Uracil phosphoribosyltransferase protein [Lasiodiplodia theobromae]
MPHQAKNEAGTQLSLTADHCSNQPPSLDQSHSAGRKAKVIGIYGIPGSGKTLLLNQLKQEMSDENLSFFEGSEVIASFVPGGLEAFQKLDEEHKTHFRQLAAESIRKECTISGKSAVVTGHLMFWPEEEESGQMVYTSNDLAVFTHILYLNVPAAVIEQRHRDDTKRSRPSATTAHLSKWQETEKDQLRLLCRDHGILFSVVTPGPSLLAKVSVLLRDFYVHTETYNLSCAESRLDEILAPHRDRWETILVIDADRTLAVDDTGALFWTQFHAPQQWTDEGSPLKSLFSSPLRYSYDAFRQATLLYEEAADDEEYESLCSDVAAEVTMYPEFVSLLQQAAQQEHIGVVGVSCGLRRVWDKVLEREGLSRTVKIVAGGRIADGLVVTAAVKAALVSRLQDRYQMYVWAFGDSPLDLEMLKKADQAVIVVGDDSARSKSMDDVLSVAINQGDLQARQVLLPRSVSPRLDASTLPVAQLTKDDLISSIFRRRNRSSGFSIFLATEKNAAKLLATPMRDSAIAGPALRKAHHRAGAYLAIEFLTSVIGVEECRISHVLGHPTTGYQLRHEPQTTIVAAMRAGEPMASGVNEVFPLAMFVHASGPENIKIHHLQGQLQVLLVDSVINSGKTILEFVQAIRKLDSHIRIVVVAGVVQAQCTSPNSTFYKTLVNHDNVSLVALRLSDTKFIGSGGTDTGNRLFNTTHLP